MVRQPLIRFRYAIQKAAAAGVKHPLAVESATSTPTATTAVKIPAPPGVVRTSQRIEKAIPRASLNEEEMEAIMLGTARVIWEPSQQGAYLVA